jgi:dipeptidyl aminopeptidase/acylaminoacyl peptidase
LWDANQSALVYTNFTAGITSLAISANGRRLAYATGTEIRLEDLTAQTNSLVTSLVSTSKPMLQCSFDGDWLAYSRFDAPWHQVYIYDVQNRIQTLVSRATNSSIAAQGDSTPLAVSPDGRFVAFRSSGNIVDGANGFTGHIYLFDRTTRNSKLVTKSRTSGKPADDHSTRAVFSVDGQTLLAQSWASDLAPGDFNRTADVFSHSILTLIILPPVPGQGVWLYWPFAPGHNYGVQYKDSLDDLPWLDFPGTATNIGVKALMQDAAPGGRRFYRVVAY